MWVLEGTKQIWPTICHRSLQVSSVLPLHNESRQGLESPAVQAHARVRFLWDPPSLQHTEKSLFSIRQERWSHFGTSRRIYTYIPPPIELPWPRRSSQSLSIPNEKYVNVRWKNKEYRKAQESAPWISHCSWQVKELGSQLQQRQWRIWQKEW